MPRNSPKPPQHTAVFSQQLAAWLHQRDVKTFGGLLRTFNQKSYALLFLILMAIPALPLPTGGVTHVFEIINMLVALEMIAGLQTIWLPKKWHSKVLPVSLTTKALPKLVGIMQRAEHFSRPRLSDALTNSLLLRFTGLIVLILTIFAFISPPFTGLDTLPALGVVCIGFSLLVGDFAFYIIGLAIGTIGIGLTIGLSGALFKALFN